MRESLEDRARRLSHGARRRATSEYLAGLAESEQVDDDSAYTIAMLLVDAALDGDEASLLDANRRLQVLYRILSRPKSESDERAEHRGKVLAFLDVTSWAIERALSLEAMAALEGDSAAFEFLKAVHETPGMTNHDISQAIGVSESDASRIGRRLADSGLAAKRRVGRRNNWEITPKGLQSLDLLIGGAARFRRPNLQRT